MAFYCRKSRKLQFTLIISFLFPMGLSPKLHIMQIYCIRGAYCSLIKLYKLYKLSYNTGPDIKFSSI